MSSKIAKRAMERSFGLVDLPKFRKRRHFLHKMRTLGVEVLPVSGVLRIPAAVRARVIVVVQDCFTSHFEPDVLLAQVALIQKLGFTPVVLSYREGGKPLHVKGFVDRFERVAEQNAIDLASLHAAGFTLVGVDGATTLMYRHEYPETLRECPEFKVLQLSEWLQTVSMPTLKGMGSYTLIQHCTERSLTPETSAQWARIFAGAGIDVRIVKAGCCGMSGLFGHEASHLEMSMTLYDQNWRTVVEAQEAGRLIATGYSCRSQIERLSRVRALHPAQVLLARWPN
jgi:Fe-S oxidoreductase